MVQLPEFIKVIKVKKNIFDIYSLFDFESTFKKRKKNVTNYDLTVTAVCTIDEMELFYKWFLKDINQGTSSFYSDFEFLYDYDSIEDYEYRFSGMYTHKKGSGEVMEITLPLVRIVPGVSPTYLRLYTALDNIRKTLKFENIGLEANVSLPISYQRLGIALMNIDNLIKEEPNDYKISNIFA